MKRTYSVWLGVVFVCICLRPAVARTWRVEKDGSGDYTAIQDAIDVAASGDTITIGPGRFEENRFAYNNGIEDINSCGYVTQNELTITGISGQTIIGLDHYNPNMNPRVCGITCTQPACVLNVVDVEIAGLFTGVHFEGAALRVEGVEFDNNGIGVLAAGNISNVIVDCQFTRLVDLGALVYCGVASLLIQDCEFSDDGWGATAIDVVNSSAVVVENSRAIGCTKGIQFEQDSSGTIDNCSVNCLGTALKISTGSHCVTANCEYFTSPSSLQYALHYDGTGSVTAEGCRFRGGALTAYIQANGVFIHNCELLNGGGQTIEAWMSASGLVEPVVLDLTGNYWGTSNTTQIDAWITDYHDFPPLNGQHWVIVDYDPLVPQSIHTKSASWGAVKSLFR